MILDCLQQLNMVENQDFIKFLSAINSFFNLKDEDHVIIQCITSSDALLYNFLQILSTK